MKKFFLLIPALVLAIAMNATTYEIGSGTSNILGTTVASANDGDVIVLTDNGPYVNVKGSDDYTKLEKNLTIQAADGVNPVIQYEVPFRSKLGKTVKFIGITFDGTSLTGYDFYFRFYDANDNNLEFEDCEFKNISKYVFDVYTDYKANSLKLTNCKLHDNSSRGILNRGTLTYLEINGGQIYNFTGASVLDNYGGATLGKVKINGTEFYGNTQDIISGTATSHADSCIINNCYFHDNTRSAVYFAASSVEGVETCDGVIVKNSTFANNNLSASSRSIIQVENYGATVAANIEVTVDHCTFYNNTTVNYDYSCIRSRKSTKVSITNSIFAYPSAIDFYATNCYGGTISNTLVYNLNYGHRKDGGNPAVTNTITAEPKFNDLANNRYTFDGNWSTGSVSPAREAATDGSDLGDPRWYTAETLPSTSFASPYQFVGAKAQISGNISYDGTNEYLYYNDKETCGTATWKISTTRACILEATLNMNAATTTGHQFKVEILDADGNSVGETTEPSSKSDAGDIVLPNQITIPAAGNYTVKLYNLTAWSSAKIDGVTFAYFGGAVQNIATDANTTFNVADAWYSGCTRDNEKTYIQYPSSSTSDAWIKWNIATSETKYYDLTVNVNTTYAHEFGIAIFEDENEEPVASVAEPGYTSSTGDGLALELGRVNLIGGKNYVVKVTNITSGSQAKVTSVVFAPVVASATTLPGTLAFSNAVLSEKAFIQDGMLYFNEIGDSNPQGQWAQWEVTTDHNGLFLFTMGVASANEQTYKITILDNLENVLDFSESNPGSGDKTIKHYFPLNTGSYFVKVENTRSFSKGHLTSFEVTEPESTSIITLDEAATSNDSWSTKVNDGNSYDVQIIRTIKAGMYNTICLPFEVTSSQAQAIFGTDVQLRTLESADIEAGDFVLNLNFTSTSSMHPGTPHLIKTSRDIVNPVFTGVKFTRETPASTTKTRADFHGTFIQTELTANENLLFLGANNTLYFPTVNLPILGMRAYFVVHDAPAGAIKRARIVENGQVVTAIDLVRQQPETNSQKLIENGQLIIIRDGVRYNVMGVKLQ